MNGTNKVPPEQRQTARNFEDRSLTQRTIMSNNRRQTDTHPGLDIDAMIAGEDDAKTRAVLVLLNTMSNSLQANTDMTRSVAEQLGSHLKNYESHVQTEANLVARGLGAWKVMAWVLSIAQLVTIAVVTNVSSRFNEHDAFLNRLALKDEQITGTTRQLESQLNSLENQFKVNAP